ncbi:MAG: acetyl-CoA carboxylase biotin carboxyl carrier protein [Hydrogenibacillus sp.]|nr:acetyl-CoA carboxylase biotin carboxyl carrier protein [Hydrogenibacillus sp.]
MFSLKELRELIRLIDQSGITHFELEGGGERLVLKKEAVNAPTPILATAPPTVAPDPAAMPEVQGPAGSDARPHPPSAPDVRGIPEQPSEPERGIHIITAPMVGTFYEAPSPGAQPFVRVGDRIEPGTVVCIIEAMKLFNEIEAEVRGVITEVLVQNGTLVEYGQPLFKVRVE